jgi:beta-galactosidase/beta-glucuronidase
MNKQAFLWQKGAKIRQTAWGHELEPGQVWPEYPRPQMVRPDWLNLNGWWDMSVRGSEAPCPERFSEKILVPFPIESRLSGVRRSFLPSQRLWYRRQFQIPDAWSGQRILLHFGAVDWQTDVWLNGSLAGKHVGGYCPFYFDITDLLLKDHSQTLLVAVRDPSNDGYQQRGKQSLWPGDIFYTAVSGIWQTVWLEPVPSLAIQALKMTPDVDAATLNLTVRLHDAGSGARHDAVDSGSGARHDSGLDERRLEIQAYAGDQLVAETTSPASQPIALQLPAEHLHVWSPNDPFLYNLQIRLTGGGLVLDEVASYFAMRKFHIAVDSQGHQRLCLNNRPLFLHGILDQGQWPDGLYLAPSDEAVRQELLTVRQMGFNLVRKHAKVEPARWYHHCDQLGLIVWQDMPSGGKPQEFLRHVIFPTVLPMVKPSDHHYKIFGRSDRHNRALFYREMRTLIDYLYNTPCVAMWVLFNEGWGQFDACSLARWVQRYDPGRWVDPASGWFTWGCPEIRSIHLYHKALALTANPQRQVVVFSEYCGFQHDLDSHKKGHWMLGYHGYTNQASLTAAYRALMEKQLAPLVRKGVSAAVYTQLTDIEDEKNGLLTEDRRQAKIDLQELAAINRWLREQAID